VSEVVIDTAAQIPLEDSQARRAAEIALNHPGADGVEVVVLASRIGLTRYALSEIIQNTVRHELRAWVRVVVGDRTASATTNQLEAGALRRAVDQALEGARASPPDPSFPGLAQPEDVGHAEPVLRLDPSGSGRRRAASDRFLRSCRRRGHLRDEHPFIRPVLVDGHRVPGFLFPLRRDLPRGR
jgi:hypothetical protein